MLPDVAKRLVDARNACQAVLEFTAAVSSEQFYSSPLLRSAVERQFEIIGEALSRAATSDPGLVALVPELPES